MLEEVADYVVLAPLVASAVVAVLAAIWLARRRLGAVKVRVAAAPNRRLA